MAAHKRTVQEIDGLLKTQGIKRLSNFIDSKSPLKLLCKKHQHTWASTPANFARYKIICPLCRKEHFSELGKKTKGRLLYSTSDIDSTLKGAYLKRLSSFKGIAQPIKVQHACGHVWEQRTYDLLQRLYCPVCHLGIKRLTPEEYVQKIKVLHPNIKLKSTFQALLKDITFKCLIHKREFTTIARNLIEGAGCPLCSKTHKIVDDESGSRMLRGREPQALAWLKANTKFKALDIQTKDLPVIRYTFAGKQRRYYPDMLVGNKIVEVKSIESAGLSTKGYFYQTVDLFDMLKAKAKAVERAGYDFRLLIMSADGRRIRIPKNWQTLDRKTVMAKLCQ